MTGQSDDPDDLIAELTRLMATDVKANPAQPEKSATPAVTEPPAERAAGAAPTIRIPGMSHPVASAAPHAGSSFDFGRAPQGAPTTAPEPLANWQDRLAAKPAPGVSPVRADGAQREEHRQDPNARQEPSLGSSWRPAIAPGEAERDAAPSGPAFEFDFGFNKQRPDLAPKAPPAPVAAAPKASGPAASGRDPIADLIAAELDAAMSAPATNEPPDAGVEDDDPAPLPAPEYQHPAPIRALAAPVPPPAPLQRANITAPPAAPMAREVPVRPAPENDRFTTAPVFGLGNRPAGEPVTPKVELDPMDEIENLIGEAVRVELNAPPPPMARTHDNMPVARHVSAQPIVPPLGTQFAPRRTSLRETEPVVEDAEDAILAAVATSGGDYGRVDDFADERPLPPRRQARREKPPRERRVRERRPSGGAFRQLVVPALAGTLLLALGFGLYWALGMGHHDGDVPVLTAEATPAKTIPEKPEATGPRSVVMDELSGTAPAPGQETLVPRDQTVGAIAAPTAAVATAAAATDANGGLANRKVRTVTVRPDGSIVSSDDSVAGAAQLPVDRPNVPSVPGAAVAAIDTAAVADPAPDSATQPMDSAAVPDAAATPAAASVEPVDPIAAITDPPPAAAEVNAPVPLPPLDRQQLAAASTGSPSQPASSVNALRDGNAGQPMDLIGDLATAADTPAPAPAQSGGVATVESGPLNAVAHVQLSSQQSVAGAQASATTLQRRFGSLFNGAKLSIVRADLGSKGVFYRVVMPTSSLGDAQQLCSSVKASGGDCVALNG